MITLQTEFKKIKRKKIGLTMCALIGINSRGCSGPAATPTKTSGWTAGFPCSIISLW